MAGWGKAVTASHGQGGWSAVRLGKVSLGSLGWVWQSWKVCCGEVRRVELWLGSAWQPGRAVVGSGWAWRDMASCGEAAVAGTG